MRSIQQGKHFTAGVEAMEFVKRNPTENLFIECGLGSSIFVVDLCYDLADTGKRVLLIIVENRVMDEYSSHESLCRKQIWVGWTEQQLLDRIMSKRHLQKLFDVVIIDQLQKTKPQDFMTFMNREKKQVIGTYLLNDDAAYEYSALEYVRDYEEKLNILKMSKSEQYRCKSISPPDAPIARTYEEQRHLKRLAKTTEDSRAANTRSQ